MFQFFPHLCPPPLPPVHHSPSPPELGPSTKITILNALHFYRVNCPTTAKHCLKMFYVVISINSIWCRNKVPLNQTNCHFVYYKSDPNSTILLLKDLQETLSDTKTALFKKVFRCVVSIYDHWILLFLQKGLKVQACDIFNVWIA